MVTVPEAARRVRCNPETVRRWIRSGRLRSRRVGTQHLIDEADLLELMPAVSRSVPSAWRLTATGEPMPDVVRAVRRSREGRWPLLVVDASAVVQACLAADGFRLFRGEALVAPPLLWSEAASVLHEMAWRREISEPLARSAFARLRAAPVARRAPARLLLEAWSVADALGWAKMYDAEYVALARLLPCRVFTLDERLRRGAGRMVEIVGPNDV